VLRLCRRATKSRAGVKSINPTINENFESSIGLRSIYANSRQGTVLPKKPRQIQADSLSKPGLIESYEERDLLAANFAVEKRYPFTDKRLVEFCLAIPREQQFRNGQPRSIARRAANDLLPQKIRHRWTKASGNTAYQNALEKSLEQIKQVVHNKDELARYIDISELDSTIKRCKQNLYSPEDQSAVWRAFSLATWLDTHSNDN
jgi:asparagine synthase (glutamine-hydrolysing)